MKNGMARPKLPYVTLLQTFAITLIVAGHSLPDNNLSSLPWVWTCHHFLYSFHIPLFMAIAGFLFVHSTDHSNLGYWDLIQKKGKRLLIPYFLISAAALIPKYLLNAHAMRPVDLNPAFFIHSLFYPRDNVVYYLWFLPTLFLIFLISPLFTRRFQSPAARTLLFLLLLLLNIFGGIPVPLFNAGEACQLLIYFYLGCQIARHRDRFLAALNRWQTAVGLLGILVGFQFLRPFVPDDPIEFNNLVYFVTATVGIFFSFSLCLVLEKTVGWFRYINGYSYTIFLFSWFFQVPVRIAFESGWISLWPAVVIKFLAGILLPVVAAKLVAHIFSGAETPSRAKAFLMTVRVASIRPRRALRSA